MTCTMRLIMIWVHKDVRGFVDQDGSIWPQLLSLRSTLHPLRRILHHPLSVTAPPRHLPGRDRRLVPEGGAGEARNGEGAAREGWPALAGKCGDKFLQEKVIIQFNQPLIIFFEKSHPHLPNLPDNSRASLDGNADHDRMSVGAAGAGRGAGASWHAGQKPVCGDE
jgi:hypothetical protein